MDDIDIVGSVSTPVRTDSLQPSDWESDPFGLELSFRMDWQQERRAAWLLLDEKNSFQKTTHPTHQTGLKARYTKG